jgi:hypothetical protein
MRRVRPRRHEGPQCGEALRLTCGFPLRRELEAGPGGGLVSCCLEKTPFMGRARTHDIAHDAFALDRPPGPQRRTGSATYRAADGPPFPLPSSAKQVGSGHSAALAELRHPNGDVALAFELVGHYHRDALFCPLRAEQILAVVWRIQPAVGGYARRHEWA